MCACTWVFVLKIRFGQLCYDQLNPKPKACYIHILLQDLSRRLCGFIEAETHGACLKLVRRNARRCGELPAAVSRALRSATAHPATSCARWRCATTSEGANIAACSPRSRGTPRCGYRARVYRARGCRARGCRARGCRETARTTRRRRSGRMSP